MAKHQITFRIPERELGRADIEFRIKRDGEVLGRLKVSNGSIVWVRKDAKYGYEMSWTDFDRIMVENGKHERE